MPDGPAYCIGMPDGPSGNGDTENGVAEARVAAGRLLASPFLTPAATAPRDIAGASFLRTAARRVVPLGHDEEGPLDPSRDGQEATPALGPFEAELLGEPGSLDGLPVQVGEPIRVARQGVVADRYCEHEPAGAGVKRGMT